jgi:hypothetical protein
MAADLLDFQTSAPARAAAVTNPARSECPPERAESSPARPHPHLTRTSDEAFQNVSVRVTAITAGSGCLRQVPLTDGQPVSRTRQRGKP